jgi:hypothetical protein
MIEDYFDPCLWKKNGDGFWDTSCGNTFEFIDGDPSENLFCFCPYCGCPLHPESYPTGGAA